MLFWLMLIPLAVGIVGIILTKNNWELEGPNFLSTLITILATTVLIVMLVIIMVNHIGADACVAANEEKYESIVYQYENDIYENDNDLLGSFNEMNVSLSINVLAVGVTCKCTESINILDLNLEVHTINRLKGNGCL